MPHYFSERQDSRLNPRKIESVLRGNRLEFVTGSGVFSPKKIDLGTALLAGRSIIKDKWEVLDLGCGYGAVGIAVAKAVPSSRVLMVDINRRAVYLAKENIRLNNIENAEARHSDIFSSVKEKFNAILLNPPQTAGKDVCFRMIEESRGFLKSGGLLQIVARHRKGGKSLKEKMVQVFNNAEDIAKKSGYRVYVSKMR